MLLTLTQPSQPPSWRSGTPTGGEPETNSMGVRPGPATDTPVTSASPFPSWTMSVRGGWGGRAVCLLPALTVGFLARPAPQVCDRTDTGAGEGGRGWSLHDAGLP